MGRGIHLETKSQITVHFDQKLSNSIGDGIVMGCSLMFQIFSHLPEAKITELMNSSRIHWHCPMTSWWW